MRDSELLRAIDSFDLEAYLSQLGADTVKGSEWLMDCPTCGKKKLTINTDRKTWHCWVCQQYTYNHAGKKVPVAGAGGLLAFIRLIEGCGRDRAVQIIQDGSSLVATDISELPELGEVDWGHISEVQPAPEIPLPPYWSTEVTAILTYCQKRGITVEDVRSFGLFWCSTGRYANRLVFPVWEHQRLVYYQARAMWDEHEERRGKYLKTLNPPAQAGMATSAEVLMNLDTARNYERVAIVEGPVDCIHAGPSAVCTFGKKISPVQVMKLKAAGVRNIDLMWDGPSPREPHGAWPEMFSYGEQLAGVFQDVRLVFLPSGDPGDYPREWLDYYRSQGRSINQLNKLSQL